MKYKIIEIAKSKYIVELKLPWGSDGRKFVDEYGFRWYSRYCAEEAPATTVEQAETAASQAIDRYLESRKYPRTIKEGRHP